MQSQTQWRVGFSGVVGLDYPAISFVADILGIEITPGTLKKIQVLECEVLEKQQEERNDG